MNILLYDHTFEGFLTAVFEAYEFKLKQVKIIKEALQTEQLFAQTRKVFTQAPKAERVYQKLKSLIGDLGLHRMLYTFLSEDEDLETHLWAVVQYALSNPNRNIIQDFSHPSVLKLSQYAQMVHREKHRMEAFVRFRLTLDGIYYAEIEPDFNVLPVIAKHFKDRYQDQKWMIFDQKRTYGIYYNLHKVELVEMKFANHLNKQEGLEMLVKDEKLYQHLWQTYFKKTTIQARKNSRLHIQHVPRRYWKYLTEKFVV